MCPLDRANTDSLWASRPRSSFVSRTCQGSAGYAFCAIIHLLQQVREVLDDDVSSVLTQRVGLPGAVDTDHIPEVAGPAGRDAGQGILEHSCFGEPHAQQLGRALEGVRSRLAAQVLP